MNKIPSSVKNAFLTVLFIFLFLYLFAKLFGPIPFSVNSINTTKTDLFNVQGEGEATAVPDTAIMSIGVTKSSAKVDAAQNEVNSLVNAIIEELRILEIDKTKIKTTNYTISPNYNYTNGENAITNYSATQNIRVEVTPIDKENRVMDIASAKGSNILGDIQFTVNEKDKSTLEKKAREDAINKAKKKAQEIAMASGIRLGKLVNVFVMENANIIQPIYADTLKAMPDQIDERETQLQPGENTVRVSVTLSYETL